MNEQDFLRKIRIISERLIDDYYNGTEIDGDIRAIELLCHNFIEIRKMKLKDKKNNNGG